MKRVIFILVAISLFFAGLSAYTEYDMKIKSILTPSVTVMDNNLIIAWVRDDGFIKISVGKLNSSSKRFEIEYNDTLNEITRYSPSITSNDDEIVLSYIDSDYNIRFLTYKYTGGKLKEMSNNVLPYKITSSIVGETKPIDIFMKSQYIFAVWMGEESVSFEGQGSGKIVLTCFSLNNGTINVETKKVLEGYTYETPPSLTVVGSYLYVSWVDENGEVKLLPFTLMKSGGGVKFIEGSPENVDIYSRNIPDILNYTPPSVLQSDGESLFIFWFNGDYNRVYMRSYLPEQGNIGYYIDESVFMKNLSDFDAIIYNEKPYMIWLDNYGSTESGGYSVKMSSID